MSTPGWYPDPAGTPDTLRWWDGTAWTQSLRRDEPRGRRPWWLLAVVVALAMVAWFVLRPHGEVTDDPNEATPTIRGWDERSTPSPSATTSPSASESDPAGGALRACPSGHPSSLPVIGGRLVAGGLSGPAPRGFSPASPSEGRFADQVATVHKMWPGSSWRSFAQAGTLPTEVFTDLRWAARQVITCHTTGQFGNGWRGQVVEADEALAIDGRPARRTRIRVPASQTPGGGARYDATVVQLADGKLAFYWTGVVLADTEALTDTEAARQDLRVER